MGFGPSRVYTATMAAAGTTATFQNMGRAFDKIYLQVPTMVSAANLDIYVSADNGTTFYQLSKEVPNTTTVQCWSFTVNATAAANGRMVPIPGGMDAYKIVADSAPAAATTFKVICGD